MRSDIEVLASAGLIDDVTTQWPLPWGGVLNRLEKSDTLELEPDYVRAAAERVEEEGRNAIAVDRVNYAVTVDFTNLPNVVRGFDALGREDAQGEVSGEWMGEDSAVRLQVGAQSLDRFDHQTLLLDGSYAMHRIGDALLYAGTITHWWGPGWDTALSLSNNARPFPQVGITRMDTKPFSSSWLSWLGPWQAEFLVGLLDGPRLARNTLFDGTRVSFNPLPGLEFALARSQELCGSNQPPTTYFNGSHPCNPFAEYINVRNDLSHPSESKDEVDFDLRYTNRVQSISYALYTQEMNRDTGPFVHSDTSHLFGVTAWMPMWDTAVRFTSEYADTISTQNFFSFNKDFYGQTYWDYKYQDGWQYRGRTLGSSLDTDSRLASFHASWLSTQNWTYTLSYYRASIGSPNTPTTDSSFAASGANRVSATPVTIDMEEAKVHVPFEGFSIDLAVRLQDDQPRPDRGFAASGEVALADRL
ncbi:MAG TPA: capsule assembly Wzi family protein [Rhizomicrobium sp.]